MIVKMHWVYPNNTYDHLVDCDIVDVSSGTNFLHVTMCRDGKILEERKCDTDDDDPEMTVFIMEHGRTVDKIEFKPKKD